MHRKNLLTHFTKNIYTDVILSAIGDGLSVHDREFRIVYQNDILMNLFGDCRGQLCHFAYVQKDSVCPDCPVAACFADGTVHGSERALVIDGRKHVLEITAAPIRDGYGQIVAAVEVVRDITERKAAEDRHIRFKNLYAALSLTNKAIMRMDNPYDLYREICRIAVTHGNFSLASVMIPDNNTGVLLPVAHCGKAKNYLDSILVSGHVNRAEGRGPTGVAFREGVPYVCNNFLDDPLTIPWRAAALENNIHSSAAFPFKQEGRVVGVLKVYSEQEGFFDREITNLLQEMSESVGFALNHYSHEAGRLQAEEVLREREERLKLVLEGSHDGYCDWDIRSGVVKVSRRYLHMLGYAVGDIKSTASALRKLIHPDDWPRVENIMAADVNGFHSAFEVEVRMLSKSNEWIWLIYRGMVVERDDQGSALRVTGTCSNIHERKRYEENLHYVSNHDSLTGLYNRAYFDTEFSRLAKSRQYPVAVLIADIDGLKLVNDGFGHVEGDRLIQQAAQALRETFRGEDLIARIGGDEFAILLPGTDVPAVNDLIKRMREHQKCINAGNHDYFLSISIGSAVAKESEQLGEALKLADSRMYYHKMQRKLRLCDTVATDGGDRMAPPDETCRPRPAT